MSQTYIEPSVEAVMDLLSRKIEGPVVMLNLLKLRGVADYSQLPDLAPKEPITGAEALQRYIEHTLPYLKASGGSITMMGKGGQFLIGPRDETWDAVMLIKQNSVKDFLDFAQNQQYLEGLGHRTAAISDSRLLPLEVKEVLFS